MRFSSQASKPATIIGAVALVLICSVTGCGSSSGHLDQSEQAPSTAAVSQNAAIPQNRIELVSHVTLSADELKQFPADFEAKAATVGWNRVADGYAKTLPAANLKVTDGVSTTTTDANGNFALPGNSASNIKLVVGDTQIPVSPSLVSHATAGGASQVKAFSVEMPFKQCTMSCCQNTGGGTNDTLKPHDAMNDGRCLDYNGWWSDGQNYDKSDWRAYRNFVQSDCDKGGVQADCWFDHFLGGCWAVHGQGGCSKVIGHSWNYHKHNFPN